MSRLSGWMEGVERRVQVFFSAMEIDERARSERGMNPTPDQGRAACHVTGWQTLIGRPVDDLSTSSSATDGGSSRTVIGQIGPYLIIWSNFIGFSP